MKRKLLETNFYGMIPPKKKSFNDFDIYEDNIPSAFLKKIKIWFGKSKEKYPRSLLGMKCWYINYMSGEKRESEYHGCELKSEDIESKELEITDKDYFSKINICFQFYITYFKISTKNGEFLEFGEFDKHNEKIIGMNLEDNMILFFSGYYSSIGIRAIKMKYIDRKDFIFYRIFELLRLRNIFKKDAKKKNFYLEDNNYNKLDLSMKCLLKTCLFPDTVFASILKYL